MNKMLKTFLGGALLVSSLSADMTRIEMGAGMWAQSPSGSITTSDTSGALSLDGTYASNGNSSTEAYMWMFIKHPVPMLPNLRLEYVTLSDSGVTTGKVNGATVSSNPTTLDMTQIDFIPYYNLLDNTGWLTLDLGLDFKIISTDAEVKGVYSGSETGVIPLLYVRTRAEIPATNVGLESDIKFITDGDTIVYDARAKVDYTFDITPVIQGGVELGYRIQKFDINADDTNGVLDYSGVYAGATVRF